METYRMKVLAASMLGFAMSACSGDNTTDRIVAGNVVDVVSQEIFPAEITIKQGKIASIKKVDGEFDTFILPGFVDSHIHVESTLMIPENYSRVAVANGVVAAVCDPHEIANVLGVEGIDYMIENGKKTRFHFNYMLPSFVPSTTFETAGCTINSAQSEGSSVL